MQLLALALTAAASAAPLQSTAPPQSSEEARCERLLERARQDPRLTLERRVHRQSGTPFVRGTYEVPENRATGEGRRIRLSLVVLPARSEDPAPDPVFMLHGGPGAAATAFFNQQLRLWMRDRRDVVMVDQRGTGGSNRLDVPMPGNDDDLQSYFETYFDRARFEAALPGLQARADLAQYTTANAVDDFDEVRAALGYESLNLRGGSYGTRSALVFMRRHPESIRTATLMGVQPIAYRNPLPHAREAQLVLDRIFEEVRSTPRYRRAFGDLRRKFDEIVQRLAAEPAEVVMRHPATGEPTTVLFDGIAFAEGVRLQLYQLPSNRRLPLLLLEAHAGDFTALAEASIASSRAMRGIIAWGTLMCVTASEDIPRIDPDEVEAACDGTFLGTTRVGTQMEVAEIWPVPPVPASFAEPVAVDVPTLLLSGSHDPTTSATWGAEAAEHLPKGLHVVVPGGHGVFGPEVDRLQQSFLEAGEIDELDLTEVEALQLPPLVLPRPK
ncbi:MAG: alpha/beta fold hydrolase [Planctomycetota bacterium]